ncbi:non-canonical purine NTP pyrophosphatase [Dyadobacter beijingensis]|uniref:dITP/XTP pyrophosphatase n=1 Tax=Dyadobacter beijingensis TaxID=365489 RepID=A0ABQ2HDU8_9BACT|nr:RdgB/HAM1 family non-canonical purine NTP pyrophosphatase [Dyadobacter beijingensis]GGM75707.1 non-canonical purine NTP pyrophosphatase [Dyadobacter beijingensis]
MKLCFATNNRHKLEEIQALLGDQFELVTLSDIGCDTDIPEPFDTIAENSREKARFVRDNYGIDCFADDTGLVVDALNGEPGVKSARYAGEHRSSDDNIDLLVKNLANEENRAARFLTVITLSVEGEYYQFEGTVEGTIIDDRRGTNGFGYDPIFVPKGHSRTFAEMTMQEKSELSHRGRAFAKLVAFLRAH